MRPRAAIARRRRHRSGPQKPEKLKRHERQPARARAAGVVGSKPEVGAPPPPAQGSLVTAALSPPVTRTLGEGWRVAPPRQRAPAASTLDASRLWRKVPPAWRVGVPINPRCGRCGRVPAGPAPAPDGVCALGKRAAGRLLAARPGPQRARTQTRLDSAHTSGNAQAPSQVANASRVNNCRSCVRPRRRPERRSHQSPVAKKWRKRWWRRTRWAHGRDSRRVASNWRSRWPGSGHPSQIWNNLVRHRNMSRGAGRSEPRLGIWSHATEPDLGTCSLESRRATSAHPPHRSAPRSKNRQSCVFHMRRGGAAPGARVRPPVLLTAGACPEAPGIGMAIALRVTPRCNGPDGGLDSSMAAVRRSCGDCARNALQLVRTPAGNQRSTAGVAKKRGHSALRWSPRDRSWTAPGIALPLVLHWYHAGTTLVLHAGAILALVLHECYT